MANVNHSTLSDPYLHEPKGISSASINEVYISDGAGSGNWKKTKRHINGYVTFDATTPAYQHSVTTSYTALNPTFSTTLVDGFSGTTTPNARLIYTGSEDIIAKCHFLCNFGNTSGTDYDIEFVFYLNGAVMNGGHVIVTAIKNEWRSVSLSDMVQLSTNDYIEIFVKGSGAFTLNLAAASLIIEGTPA